MKIKRSKIYVIKNKKAVITRLTLTGIQVTWPKTRRQIQEDFKHK